MLRLFTKTYQKDYPWLKLAIKSLLKLCQERIDWTFVGDPGSKSEMESVVSQAIQETQGSFNYRLIESQELWPECAQIQSGYLSQQWIKMNSHMAMGDDLFWNWDSDVIAVKPLSSNTFIGKSGKPIYWFSQFNSIMNGADTGAHQARISVMKEIFGLPEISFEWMRCMPVAMYGQILRNGSERNEWKKSFELLKNADGRFSEFNIIGQFSHLYFPDAYEWKNAESSGPTWSGGYVEGGVGSGCFQEHASIAQCWSWGSIPSHIQEFVDKLDKP